MDTRANASADPPTEHIILCGLDGLGFRTLEELLRLGEIVTAIDGPHISPYAARARRLGVNVVHGDYRDEDVLKEARIAWARSLIVAHDDDVGNLHAALAAYELNPRVRIVLRMFNVELGSRLEQLFSDAAVLSSSAIAAPAFVAAALHGQNVQQVEVAGQTLGAVQDPGEGDTVLLPLMRTNEDGTAELFPATSERALSLVRMEGSDGAAGPAARKRKPVLRSMADELAALWAVLRNADRRFRLVLGLVALIAGISTLIFYFFFGLTLSDAVYFTLTIITTTGFGDISLRSAPLAIKMYGTLLMVLGAASLTLFYALIADSIVSARLAKALGAAHTKMHDHIVVCGLGNIGYRVVERLTALGIPVQAVELHESARFIPSVRRLGVPVLIADARMPESLRALTVDRARCLIVATDDDVANLETALQARALKPDLRVVMRLFEPDLADRVQRTFNIQISRSVSALAAPAFAAAAVGRQVVGTIEAGPAILVLARARVEPGSACVQSTVSEMEAGTDGRVLFLESGGRITRPPPATMLGSGQELVVVATRMGLTQILRKVEAVPKSSRGDC